MFVFSGCAFSFLSIFSVCMCISLPWLKQTPERLVFALARKPLLNSLKTEKSREFECHWKKSDWTGPAILWKSGSGGGQTLVVVIIWGVVETKRFRSNHHLCVPSSDQNKITCQLSHVTISVKRNCVFEVPSTLFRGGGDRNRSVVCGNCIIMDKEHLTFSWEPLYHLSVCDS